MPKIRWPILDAFLGRRKQQVEPPDLIIVGLGNPGSQYAMTRHNVGFWCVDRIASERSVALSRRHRSAQIGEGLIEDHRIVLVKPRTYVNRSGEPIAYLLARYGVTSQSLLVIYDDINLPLEKIRLRPGGSAGGHNGIKSIIEVVGTQDFPRLRVGVGRPSGGSDQIEYVLGTMSEDEQRVADEVVERVAQAVTIVLTDGIETAMNKFN